MPIEMTVAELAEREPGPLGTSDWIAIEQPRVDEFASATNDHQWIHVDQQRAAEGPFGTTIAHGFLTVSLAPHLLKQCITITDAGRGTNYGIERVRFTAPVPVGSRIRMAAELVDAQRRDDGGVKYRVGFTMEIEGQDRPACVGESLLITYPQG